MEAVRRLKVFVGSPSDNASNRDAAKQAIELVGCTLENDGLILQSRMWELDAKPDVAEDAQASLNRQIVADCDVYIFLFHTRLGTPTPRAASGTAEEMALALARLREESAHIRILTYFDASPIPPTTNARELGRLQDFRAQIQASGILCIEFNGATHLKDRLIKDLRSAVVEVANSASQNSPVERREIRAIPTDPAVGDEEGAGVLEYVAAIQETVAISKGDLETFVDFQNGLSTELSALTEDVKTIAPVFAQMPPSEQLKLMNGYAERIDKLADGTELHARQLGVRLADLSAQIEGVVGEIVRGEVTETGDGVRAFSDPIASLCDSVAEAAGSARTLEDSIRAWPGFTQKFKKARNRLAKGYLQVRSAMESAVASMRRALEALSAEEAA